MGWEELFKPWVLERGRECYEDGAVSVIRRDEHIAEAVVSGCHKAWVETDEGELVDAGCDCPYSSKGNHCKHVAALLYALAGDDEDIGQVVDGIPEGRLRELVRTYAGRDASFLRFLKEEGDGGADRTYVSPLTAFEGLMRTVTEDNAAEAVSRLRELAAGSSPESRAVMVIRLSDWMEENQDKCYVRMFEEAAFECFQSEAERLLEYVDGRLLDPGRAKLDLYVPEKLRLLRALGMDEEFISPFRREHLDIPEALEDEVRYLKETGREEDALRMSSDGGPAVDEL